MFSKLPIEINVLNKDADSLAMQAWKISRPGINYSNKHIRCVDAPINDMMHWTLHFKVPILIREILVTHREHLAWARTSRVDDLLNSWDIWEGVGANQSFIDHSYNLMQEEATRGIPQDSYRTLLPMGYMTEFAYKISHRNLMRMTNYFQGLAELPDPNSATSNLYIEVARRFRRILEDYLDYLSYFKPTDMNPMTHYYGDNSRGDINYLVIDVNSTWSLRSQVIRHGALHVVDDLRDLMKSNHALGTSMRSPCHMSISAPIETWKDITRKRNCWLAHTNLWSPILEEVAKNIVSEDGEIPLPCSNNTPCPYSGDSDQRLAGTDPGVPCPIHYLQNKNELIYSQGLRERMSEYVVESSRPKTFWESKIGSI